MSCRTGSTREGRSLGIDDSVFVHKLPICVQGEPPVVHFVHLVTDDTGRGFEQFLIDHARLVEVGQLGGLSVADLDRFRDARGAFSVPAIDSLCARWLLEGESAFACPAADDSSTAARFGQLVMEQVPGQYAQFGALAGVV